MYTTLVTVGIYEKDMLLAWLNFLNLYTICNECILTQFRTHSSSAYPITSHTTTSRCCEKYGFGRVKIHEQSTLLSELQYLQYDYNTLYSIQNRPKVFYVQLRVG